jgi:hypothetical protein
MAPYEGAGLAWQARDPRRRRAGDDLNSWPLELKGKRERIYPS